MPSLVEWIFAGLGWALSSAVGRFFSAASIAFLIYNFAVEPWIEEIASKFSGLPSFVSQLLAYFGIDKAITMVASAFGIKFAGQRISGLTRKSGAMEGGDL